MLKQLNLGCGPVQPPGWINVDASIRARLAANFSPLNSLLTSLRLIPPTEFNTSVKTYNLLKPLPIASDSIDNIYAGELWEHFEYADAERLTRECLRVLRPGGVLRVCVPDGVQFWREYLNKFDAEMQRPVQQRRDDALKQHTAMFFRDICTKRLWLKSLGHVHKWQYDEIQLVSLFQRAGFTEVSRRKFHESRIADVRSVERSDFLIVEGIKPTGLEGASS